MKLSSFRSYSQKAFQKLKSHWKVTVLVCALVAMIGGVWLTLFYREGFNLFAPIKGEAAFTPYQGGQVSIDHTFFNGANEVQNIIVDPGSDVTVRLQYDNTGELQAGATSILTTIPSGFTFVPGSLRNVYRGKSPVTLDNALFSGRNLTVSPSAGLYGFSTNSSSGILDMGKREFLRVQRCSVIGGDDEFFISAANDLSYGASNPTSNNCASVVGGGFLSGFNIDISQSRYLKVVSCVLPSGQEEIYAQFASNILASSASDSTSNICASTSGSTFDSVYDIDLLSGRYLRVQTCDHPTLFDELFVNNLMTSSALATGDGTGSNCSNQISGSSFDEAFSIDLYDSTNGGGYIEFQMTVPPSAGCYSFDTTMNSSSFSPITEVGGDCDIRIQESSSFGNGTVSYQKVFWNGISEINAVTTPPGGTITIRLRYSNTADESALRTYISDSFETDTFEYIPGTAQSCYSDTDTCISLDDSVFETGTIRVGPLAGWYGYPTDAETTNLEVGKDRYLKIIHCSNGAQDDYFLASTGNTTSTITGNCSNFGLASYNKTGEHIVDIRGKRYLNTLACTKGAYVNTFIAGASNVTGASTALCSDFGLVGYTETGGFSIDLLNNTHLNSVVCSNGGVTNTVVAEASRTSGASAQTCNDLGMTGYTATGGSGIQYANIGRGYGYIQYQIQSFDGSNSGQFQQNSLLTQAESGQYGQNSTLAQDTTILKECPNGGTVNNNGDCIVTRNVTYANTTCQTGNPADCVPVANQQVNETGYGTNDGWALVSGSITNNWNGERVTLSDSLYGANGLTAAPSAGLFGQSNALTTGTLQYPHITTFRWASCIQPLPTDSVNDRYIVDLQGSESGDDGLCTFTNAATEENRSLTFTNQRYINHAYCSRSFSSEPATRERGPGQFWNATQNPENNDSCGAGGYSNDAYLSHDMLNNRYLLTRVCGRDLTVSGFTFVEYNNYVAASNNPNAYPACAGQYNPPTSEATHIADFYDPTKSAQGTIQYQVSQPGVCPIGYIQGTNLNECLISATSFSSILSLSENTITIIFYCDTINPIGGVRNLTLSDAELRTDQDFTCNYGAQICPTIFEDSNLNSERDAGEAEYNAVTVELRRNSDNSFVSSLITDTQNPQCFINLASGEAYDVVVPNPPTTFSTTGGDVQTIEASLIENNQIVEFGYADGGVVLLTPNQVFFPPILVSSEDVTVSSIIDNVEVNDLRPDQESWTVTATIQDFVGVNQQNNILPIANRFTTSPQTVSAANGENTIVSPGAQRTVSSTIDSADIFNTGANDGSGNYTIPVNVDYSVPAFSPADSYQTIVTFTLI